MKDIGLMKAIRLVRKADRMTPDERLKLQKERLASLVGYARENSPYFARLYQGIGSNPSLDELPVTDKKALMGNFDDWMTDRSITKQKVDDFMKDILNAGKMLDGRYLVYSTSGSTGNPCIVLYDKTAINAVSAIGVVRSFARKEDLKSFMRKGGKTIALFADNGFYLGCGSARYSVNRMPWKRNKIRTCDVRKPAEDIVSLLNEYQPSMVGCYPTVMEILASEQEKGRLDIHPAIIMTGGEQLDDDVREHLSAVFGCYVQTNYSCTEGGTVACECVNRHFHVNDDWIILEAVDEANQPVPSGVQSAKVLLTNLSNRICPIIRFEIRDRVIMHDEPCGCGDTRQWLTLEGRTDDMLEFSGGVRIAPLPLYAVLKETGAMTRFQIVQTGRDSLEIRLSAENRECAGAEAKKAIEGYLSANGVKADIMISENAPEADKLSGKFRHVISLSSRR